MKEVVIVSGARTAVGEFGGALKGIRTVDLGALVIKKLSNVPESGLQLMSLSRSCRPDALGSFEMTEINKKYYDYNESLKPVYVDEVIMGNVLQADRGKMSRRQASIMPDFLKRPTLLQSIKYAHQE